MNVEFKKGDRVRATWNHQQRGTVEGRAPYNHHSSRGEELLILWDDGGFGQPLRQEIDVYAVEHLPIVDRIAELDG